MRKGRKEGEGIRRGHSFHLAVFGFILLYLGFLGLVTSQTSSRSAATTPPPCHCLNPQQCDQTQGICNDYQCDRGWGSPPYCQSGCVGQTFGSNCESTCHCRPNGTCNILNGYCSTGCDVDWGGTACQTRLPKLTFPPDVNNITCDILYVTWRAWNQALDIGGTQLSIASYSLEQRVNYSSSGNVTVDWINRGEYQSQPGITLYVVPLPVDNSYNFLEFRVVTNWYDLGKMFPGLPSPSSPAIRPIASCVDTPGPVISLVGQVQPLSSSIRFTWSIPANASIGLTSYEVGYGIVGIGDCNSTYTGPWTSSVTLSATTTSYVIWNTDPWRKYAFMIIANNVAGNGPTTNTTIISQEIKPTGTIQNLASPSVTSREVSLVWDDVSCVDRGGRLIAYEVTVTDPIGGFSIKQNVSQRAALFSSLTPFTRYSVTVRYFNQIGAGPSSTDFFVTTLADVPPAPRSVVVSYATDTVLQVTWSAPIPPNGAIQQYRVSYWRNGDGSSVIQTTLDASQTIYNITGLTPYTVYCVQVQAQTGVTSNEGWGNRSVPLCNQTLEGLPTAPMNLQTLYVNESCISIQWSPPTTANGFLVSYKVTYASKSVPNGGQGQVMVSTSQLNCWICTGLQPDVQYNIQVQASTSRGFGAAASVDVWTVIGQPERPPVPQIISVQNTTAVVRIEPAVLSYGPVASYFIVVSLLQSSPVSGRKRRASPQDPTKFIPLPGYTAAQLSKDDVTQARDFIIGDNNSYGGYTNLPLTVNDWYSVYYVVASSRDGNAFKMNYAQTTSAFQTGSQLIVTLSPTSTTTTLPIGGGGGGGGLTEGQKAGIALGILIPLLLLALLLLLLYFCWWKKRKQPSDMNDRTWLQFYMMNYSDPMKQKWNDIYSLEDPRYVITSNGTTPVAAAGATGGGPEDIDVGNLQRKRPTISFEEEYKQLPVGLVFRCSEAEKRENADKNRFDHLLAYDHTRVRLMDVNDGLDYYNANYVPGYDRRRKAYIAAQSPFNEKTICDFWLMVYEQNVSKIVFMAQLLEDSVVKSEKYWNDDHLTHPYGTIAVTLQQTHIYANFVVRSFNIAKMGQSGSRQVKQYQFTSWPEHGVPDDPYPVLEFRRKVGTSPDVPLLVHCGTGVSRSAVFIAIDYCLAKAEAENCVNVYRCCSTMRQCRTMMVRTLKQYIFIYDALFEALVTSHAVVNQDVKSTYDTLKKIDPKTNVSHFKQQFQMLEKYVDAPTDDQCKIALGRDNANKNRFSTLRLIVRDRDLIPMRNSSSFGPVRLSYINALTLDTYTDRGAFIVTQSPLATTLTDFWSVIYDQEISCIVSLNGQSFKEDSCVDYLPKVPRVVQRVDDNFYVTLMEQQHTDHVTISLLQLEKEDGTEVGERRNTRTGRRGKTQQIQHFLFQSWNMYEQFPWSNEGFLQLIDLVSRARSNDLHSIPTDLDLKKGRPAPVVVHCIDGASQSGLFCACYIICQKMSLEREVDVFHSVKQMKHKRLHFVNSVDQYKFCFKLLWDFINTRMNPSIA